MIPFKKGQKATRSKFTRNGSLALIGESSPKENKRTKNSQERPGGERLGGRGALNDKGEKVGRKKRPAEKSRSGTPSRQQKPKGREETHTKPPAPKKAIDKMKLKGGEGFESKRSPGKTGILEGQNPTTQRHTGKTLETNTTSGCASRNEESRNWGRGNSGGGGE